MAICNAAGEAGKTPGCSDTGCSSMRETEKGTLPASYRCHEAWRRFRFNWSDLLGDKREETYLFFMETKGIISALAGSDILTELHQVCKSGFPFTEAILSLSQHPVLFFMCSVLLSCRYSYLANQTL